MESIKFSVVIPLYNKEKHISHTIETVLEQTYSNFELIIVDDGSTDSSAQIVSKIQDDRIRLFCKNNEGETSTRNFGVKQANGDYVAFIDADDEWYPFFLEEIAKLIDKYPDAGVYATALAVHERNGEEYCLDYPGISKEKPDCLIENYFVSGLKYSPISSSSVCVSKRAFESVGGFVPKVKNGGDLDLWCRMALKYPFAFSTRPAAVYRRDSDNMMSRSPTTPCFFPFLTQYKRNDADIIADKDSIEQYILQREFDAVSSSLFVIRSRKIAKKILNSMQFQHLNRVKYIAFKLIAILPQPAIDLLYRFRLKRIKTFD